MRKKKLSIILGAIGGVLMAGGLALDYVRAPEIFLTEEIGGRDNGIIKEKTLEERVAEAQERSQNRKGVYMTYEVASDAGAAATRLRENILKLVAETELNAVVIDVKESKGAVISERLQNAVKKFKERGIWTIARMTMMRDDSQTKLHPELYITNRDGGLWRDNHGHAWLDPAHRGVFAYNTREIKKAIDLGFDEIQYDYVRFPSDGNMRSAIYPEYDGKTAKHVVIKKFLATLKDSLKKYKPEIILSADLFGQIAVQADDLSIGQRLIDIGETVDYISLMVYPSHYYAGFYVPRDAMRNLASIFIPYQDKDSLNTASSKPYDIVYRSMLAAGDVLAGHSVVKDGVYMRATSTPAEITPVLRAKLRPWLQDFDLGIDKTRGIYYDAAKVRAQIRAAKDAGTSGWLLWNPSNVYTAEALQMELE